VNYRKLEVNCIVGMKEFHCDVFELVFEFPPEEFDLDAFVTEAGINKEEYIDEDGDFVAGVSFGARDENTDYHSHARILVFKEGKSRINVSYHDSKADKVDAKSPYVEDCVQWLGGFLRADKLTARIHATYLFDNSFSPTIGLPFPLITTDKSLAGGLVTGLSVAFPKEERSEMVIIQRAEDETFFAISTESEINLADFDLLAQLRKLSTSTDHLIKKQDARNEKASN
jgi:hypothetical protein